MPLRHRYMPLRHRYTTVSSAQVAGIHLRPAGAAFLTHEAACRSPAPRAHCRCRVLPTPCIDADFIFAEALHHERVLFRLQQDFRPLLPTRKLFPKLTRMMSYTLFCFIANGAGLPSASLPLHWNDDGLPIGVLATGQAGSEELLFSWQRRSNERCPGARGLQKFRHFERTALRCRPLSRLYAACEFP